MNSSNSGTTNQAWTVKAVLDWTIGHLKQAGSESPRLDAEILLAHARGCQRIQLYTSYETLLSDSERSTMRELVRRRAKMEPVAYLVGYREFFGLNFEVTQDVLIPRPDTETLVLEAIEHIGGTEKRVLEIGTGSGCIAVSIAARCPRAQVVAVDCSAAAIAMAEKNASRHNVQDRIDFRLGSTFAPLESEERFDVIVSNPPYIGTDEIPELMPDVRLHEPHLALDGGADGLDIIRDIVAGLQQHLHGGGLFLMEIAPEQENAVRDLCTSIPVVESVTGHRDLSGSTRVMAVRFKNS